MNCVEHRKGEGFRFTPSRLRVTVFSRRLVGLKLRKLWTERYQKSFHWIGLNIIFAMEFNDYINVTAICFQNYSELLFLTATSFNFNHL